MSSLYLAFCLLLGIQLVYGGDYNSNCPGMSNSLDDGCSINDDCTKITCTIDDQGDKVLSWTIKINKCEEPVTIDVTIDAGFIHWSKTFTSDERVGVPGLSTKIPLVGSAGVFVKVSLPDSGSNLNLKIEMLFGLEVGDSFKQVGESTTIVNSELPVNTYECGFVRFWTNLDLPFKILLVIGAVVVFFTMICCCYCCCCRQKAPQGGVVITQAPPPAATVISTNNTNVPMKPFVNEI